MIPDDYDSDSGSVYFRAYINGKITHSFISVEREKNIITFKDLRHEIERDLTLPFLHFRLLLGIDAVVSPNRIQEEMWCVSEYRLMDSGNGSLERMPLLSHIAYQFMGVLVTLPFPVRFCATSIWMLVSSFNKYYFWI